LVEPTGAPATGAEEFKATSSLQADAITSSQAKEQVEVIKSVSKVDGNSRKDALPNKPLGLYRTRPNKSMSMTLPIYP